MDLQVDTLVLGPLETNCHVLTSDGQCWVVDPGMGLEPLLEFLTGRALSPSKVLLTHGHGDHIAGAAQLAERFPDSRLVCPTADADMLTDPQANLSAPFGMALTAPPADELISPGQVLTLGQTDWQVLDTSGHTPGGVSFYCPQAKIVITGDALFAGSIGRTDIPGGSASRLLRNIREQLLSLPDETAVLPGHGPATTVGTECRRNPCFAP